MRSTATPLDASDHTPAPVGMVRRSGGWSPLPRPVFHVEHAWERHGQRPKPEVWTPTMERLLNPDAGYPTLMDLVVAELLSPQGDWPSDAP